MGVAGEAFLELMDIKAWLANLGYPMDEEDLFVLEKLKEVFGTDQVDHCSCCDRF